MDPFTAVFASYIDLVSDRAMQDLAADGAGTQSVVVEHQGIRVPYSYQDWQVQYPSVCDGLRSYAVVFSRCTVAAQSLFNETCTYLQEHPSDYAGYPKLKDMYCHAALSYQSSSAEISWSAQRTKVDEAREQCNLAVAQYAADRTDARRIEKETACKRYHALQAQEAKK